MSQSVQQPLSSLAQTVTPKVDCPQQGTVGASHHNQGYGGYFAWAILWFIILTVIIWLVLVAANPKWIQKNDYYGKCNGEVDNGKAILWAIVIAFLILIFVWILKALATWGSYKSY